MERIKAGINTNRRQWEYVFSPGTREKLSRYLELDEPLIPEEANTEESAARSVEGAEVILSTWGAAPYTRKVLDACPDLKLILYGAGAFKSYVTDGLLARDVTVCTAVHLNAVPTAEFSLALILTSM